MRVLVLAAALLMGACAGKGDMAKPPPSWQSQVREPDRKQLATLWNAWTRALAQVDSGGMRADLAALGDLVVPEPAATGALTEAARAALLPGPGDYRCRTITLGIRDTIAAAPAVKPMTVGPAEPCAIRTNGNLLTFEQLAGAQRIGGRLFADGERMVFLGSVALAGEVGMLPYGDDGERDQVGVLRAYGENRWRIELPWPQWQSNMTIIEILPA